MKRAIFKQILSGMIVCGFLALALPAADIVPFTGITPAQAAALIKAKGANPHFVILDVRTAEEFAENRIKGAKNIDGKAPDFKEKLKKLAKNAVYLVYCRDGQRSSRVMKLMRKWGFTEAYKLGGGLMKWQAEKLPLEGKPLTDEPMITGKKGKRK